MYRLLTSAYTNKPKVVLSPQVRGHCLRAGLPQAKGAVAAPQPAQQKQSLLLHGHCEALQTQEVIVNYCRVKHSILVTMLLLRNIFLRKIPRLKQMGNIHTNVLNTCLNSDYYRLRDSSPPEPEC